MANNLKYLVAFLITFFNCIAMHDIQVSLVDNKSAIVSVESELDSNQKTLFMQSDNHSKLSHNNSIVPISNHNHSKRDSIILHNTPSRLSAMIANLRKTKKIKTLENIIIKNRNDIKVISAITTVLLLYFFYEKVSSFTFAAQKFAGMGIAEYCSYKRMNLFLMAIFFKALAETFYYIALHENIYTGLATTCDIAMFYLLIRCLGDNVFRKMMGKNENEVCQLEERIIVPKKYKKDLIFIEEMGGQ